MEQKIFVGYHEAGGALEGSIGAEFFPEGYIILYQKMPEGYDCGRDTDEGFRAKMKKWTISLPVFTEWCAQNGVEIEHKEPGTRGYGLRDLHFSGPASRILFKARFGL